ncbi:protein phosphatase 2A regulatory subunit CDC55 [Ascoidea rubescens DSM 1968]|uniref:Protein phosphatase PP2A regulatory subunit B n=1 Tax=Ascoidea rubescens DSM 1968 TaxID=1344418 RepID=A0A1D2VBB6_9ASCO|nr:protein phosphatase 2A regulatory subunit PR55 [Ascoidea rubescens DSM 1968]ODV58885.1 protein phosphatase 2A regulatory subunit PR55 [Ascoidea rubescens DSM 1968]
MSRTATDSTDLNQVWKFSQCFGDKAEVENITEADIISAVEFDHTGDYLATGDRGGRVVLFERNFSKKNCEYKFHTEFQSHDAEFDYLKSLEIEEKINRIRWCKRSNQAHFLLSTNDKTIKLWKIYEKNIKVVSTNNLTENIDINNNNNNTTKIDISLNSLHLPKLEIQDKIIAASPKRIFANAHSYHINSITLNSDGETFISCDDLRVNLWNLGIANQCFNIIDIKPVNMEELTEVLTSAAFHPTSCNIFMYSSSKGIVKLADMRENAFCDSKTKVFEEHINPQSHNFFTEITSSISDVKFSNDGQYIASRDYMTAKIWDVRMENKPVRTINVHNHLREKLCDVYEVDAIFDKFQCVFSGDSKSILTGSYNNNFMIYPNVVSETPTNPNKKFPSNTNNGNVISLNTNNFSNRTNDFLDESYYNEDDDDDENEIPEIVLTADKPAFKAKRVGVPSFKKHRFNEKNPVDFTKGILHYSWHPRENSVAIAATNNLYIFSTL